VDEMSISPFLIPIMGIMIPITAVIGAFVYLIVKTVSHSRVRELEIKERIAMIERGIVPAPEVDPSGFDRAMERHQRRSEHRVARSYAAGRHRRSGVTLMGVGFGMMVLIGIAGQSPLEGLGVGGAIVILGLAFFVNSLYDHPDEPPAPVAARYTPPPPAPTPQTSQSDQPRA
jgi:hypothetical protein